MCPSQKTVGLRKIHRAVHVLFRNLDTPIRIDLRQVWRTDCKITLGENTRESSFGNFDFWRPHIQQISGVSAIQHLKALFLTAFNNLD